jgi:hypothetical protein
MNTSLPVLLRISNAVRHHEAACRAITDTLSLGSVAYEAEVTAKGEARLSPSVFFEFVCDAVASVLDEENPTAVPAFVGVDSRIAAEAEWLVMPADHKPVLITLRALVGTPELFRQVFLFLLPIWPHRAQPLVEPVFS